MAVNQDPKLEEVRLSPSTVCRVVGKRRAVKAYALTFDSKTKDAREAKHVDLGTKVISWFRQPLSYIGHATKVHPFAGKCGVREQLSKHQGRTLFDHCTSNLTFFKLKNAIGLYFFRGTLKHI